jgi:hypothetical protein
MNYHEAIRPTRFRPYCRQAGFNRQIPVHFVPGRIIIVLVNSAIPNCYLLICDYPDTLRYRDCSTSKFQFTSFLEFESHEKKGSLVLASPSTTTVERKLINKDFPNNTNVPANYLNYINAHFNIQ